MAGQLSLACRAVAVGSTSCLHAANTGLRAANVASASNAVASPSRSNRHGRSRGRSRKRRPASSVNAGQVVHGGQDEHQAKGDASAHRKKDATARAHVRARPDAGFVGKPSAGERPPAPWHPWPLSELLIFIGAIGAIVGWLRLAHGGFANGGPVLLAGLGAVVLGTLEITWREHRAGYRSHALLLALLPVVVFHSAVILTLTAFIAVPRLLNIGLLALDLALFAVLFRLLRAQFADARVRATGRRR
jgi:hypothetical protein